MDIKNNLEKQLLQLYSSCNRFSFFRKLKIKKYLKILNEIDFNNLNLCDRWFIDDLFLMLKKGIL